ncbi:Hypothetical predicted protein [Lecanosticta acicola]|uniref:SGNH hydrolase-type esterase domain-containing protein n=1 Tax=Lecanosticta acicola TaxID=111012 RepID=A0AAI8Z354_9PEZI|nr:Hypothetical predicted protein [Lecanosticta acicola]
MWTTAIPLRRCAPYAAVAFFTIFVLAAVRFNVLDSARDLGGAVAKAKGAEPCTVSPRMPLRIMPLGDSITFGMGSAWGNGYRAFLYDYLMASCGQREVTFIGSQHSGPMSNGETEGYPGYSIASIANKTQPALSDSLDRKPNVVLLHAGTNDFAPFPHDDEPNGEAPERLEWLIDYILQKIPETTLIVAQIISCPLEGFRDWIPIFNAAIPHIVEKKVASGFKVLVADMSQIGIDGSGDLVDDLHPGDHGYEKMAKLWHQALETASEAGLITQ